MKITFLGTGGSLGVPILGCRCAVCRSGEPRNRRLRPSLWVRFDGKSIVIDASPDFRRQALDNGVERADALLLTHAHADHCLGMDDLRIIVDRQRAHLPLFASGHTLTVLKRLFGYLFDSSIWNSDIPRFKPVVVEAPVTLFGLEFRPLPVLHEDLWVMGWRFDAVAYITDASEIPRETEEALGGLDLLVINALRYVPHPKHFSVEQALSVIEKVKPKTALLTHMSHELDYEKLKGELPGQVSPAYDGLTVEL